jgi:hypothetical protein
MSDAVFIPADGGFIATELARGPWDPAAQHGGAPAALLMRAFERLPAADGLVIVRVTYEFLRPVPLGKLALTAEVTRAGRRAQLMEAWLADPEGVEVVRARALQVHHADAQAADAADGAGRPEPGPPPRSPEQGSPSPPPPVHQTGLTSFATDALEIRFVSGAIGEPGPGSAWFRVRVPLVAGEEVSPLQRLAATADFGNGIGSALPWSEWLFINPDLTIYVDRPPVGEWIGLDAATSVAAGGAGIAQGMLSDREGRVGRTTQALLVARR